MNTELINPITMQWIEAYIKRPYTTLLVSTKHDSATGNEISDYVCRKLSDQKNPHIYRFNKIKDKSIGIEDVKDLRKYLTLNTDNKKSFSRFVIINGAEKLTTEAQNSILKLLEEIPNNTIVILVVSDISKMLNTIISRCFFVDVLPITVNQSNKYISSKGINKNLGDKILLLSEGNITDYKKMLNDNDIEKEYISEAKKFLTSTVFDRQLMLQSMFKKEENIVEFVKALKIISRISMRKSATLQTKMRWKTILSKIILAEKQLDTNVQQKIVMLSLSVSV